MENINTFKKVDGFKFEGKQVYKGFQFENFIGYFFKTRSKQLKIIKTIKGNQYKEVNAGWKYEAYSKDNKLTWEQWLQWAKETNKERELADKQYKEILAKREQEKKRKELMYN